MAAILLTLQLLLAGLYVAHAGNDCDRKCPGLVKALSVPTTIGIETIPFRQDGKILQDCLDSCRTHKFNFIHLYNQVLNATVHELQRDTRFCKLHTRDVLHKIESMLKKKISEGKRDEHVKKLCEEKLPTAGDYDKAWIRGVMRILSLELKLVPATLDKGISQFLDKKEHQHVASCLNNILAVYHVLLYRMPRNLQEFQQDQSILHGKQLKTNPVSCKRIMHRMADGILSSKKFKIMYITKIFDIIYSTPMLPTEQKKIMKATEHINDWEIKAVRTIIDLRRNQPIRLTDDDLKTSETMESDLTESMITSRKVRIVKKFVDSCMPTPNFQVELRSEVCDDRMEDCSRVHSSIKVQGTEHNKFVGKRGHVCAAFSMKTTKVVDVFHVRTTRDDKSAEKFRQKFNSLPNEVIITCAVQGDGALYSSTLKPVFEKYGADFTEISRLESWAFIGYKGNDVTYQQVRNGWLPWVTTIKSDRPHKVVEIEAAFKSTLIFCDTNMVCPKEPRNFRNSDRLPQCFYISCLNPSMKYCMPCPRRDERNMMTWNQKNNRCM